MVQVTNYAVKTKKDGTTFITLELTGGLELVQSTKSGKFYATIRKCSMPSTFSEEIAKQLIGSSMEGTIARVSCPVYDYTIKATGEVIQLAHPFEFMPVDLSAVASKREVEFA